MKIQKNWLHTDSPERDQVTYEQTHQTSSNIITSHIQKVTAECTGSSSGRLIHLIQVNH